MLLSWNLAFSGNRQPSASSRYCHFPKVFSLPPLSRPCSLILTLESLRHFVSSSAFINPRPSVISLQGLLTLPAHKQRPCPSPRVLATTSNEVRLLSLSTTLTSKISFGMVSQLRSMTERPKRPKIYWTT